MPFDEVLPLLPVPHCPTCGSVLKPDVVMFGELLPQAAIARATELAAEAQLLLVVGSSLEVYPVAGLPLETLAAGGSLAIVNRGATQFDARVPRGRRPTGRARLRPARPRRAARTPHRLPDRPAAPRRA